MDFDRKNLTWAFAGRAFQIPIDRKGTGPTVLMLPALSSISTLQEMKPLQALLAGEYSTVAVDWPGFGETGGPVFDWTPAALAAYLDHVLDLVGPAPLATIAAGHAAGYLLDAVRRRPGTAGRLILVAPTWRGPLPTMMGRRSSLGRTLVRLGDIPVLGQALYRLNVNRPTVGFMTREHVYDDPSWLDERRLAAKMAVTRASGARYGALRFVTGELDPMANREEFLSAAGTVRDPILVIYGAHSPLKSRLEMDALAALPNVAVNRLMRGKLAVHEEQPEAVFQAMLPILDGSSLGG